MLDDFLKKDVDYRVEEILEKLGAERVFGMIKLNIRQLNTIAKRFREDYLTMANIDMAQAIKEKKLGPEYFAKKTEEIDIQKDYMLERLRELLGSLDNLEAIGARKLQEEDFNAYDRAIDSTFAKFLDGTYDRYEHLMNHYGQVALLLTDEDKVDWEKKLTEKDTVADGEGRFKEYLKSLNDEFKKRLREIPKKRFAETFRLVRLNLNDSNARTIESYDAVKKVYDALSKISDRESLIKSCAYDISIAEMVLKESQEAWERARGICEYVFFVPFSIAIVGSWVLLTSPMSVILTGAAAILTIGSFLTLGVAMGFGLWDILETTAQKKGLKILERLAKKDETTYLDTRQDLANLFGLCDTEFGFRAGFRHRSDFELKSFFKKNEEARKIVEEELFEDVESAQPARVFS